MAANANKESVYTWEGKDKRGKLLKGEIKASGESFIGATLRRQGITVIKIKKQSAFKLPWLSETILRNQYHTKENKFY